MSRNKIDANASIFQTLDAYCADRGDPLSNAGQIRWVATRKEDREFLVYAKLVQQLPLSPTLKAASFDFRNQTYLITAGFDSPEPPEGFAQLDLSGGILTAFLYEAALRPSATTIEIREVIEVGDNRDRGYDGHDFAQIRSLYSSIQVFTRESQPDEDAKKSFLLLCLADRRRYDHWIDDGLARSLSGLITVNTTAIPFDVLCRAILDFDPSTMFLALYRSLEALYSREQTMSLKTAIGIPKSWVELAQELELHLGWHPREEPSLEAVLKSAQLDDLTSVLEALGVTTPVDGDLHRLVTRKIYTLRNNLVHYRQLQQSFSPQNIDWCRLCEAMNSIVMAVYAETAVPDVEQQPEHEDAEPAAALDALAMTESEAGAKSDTGIAEEKQGK